MVDPVDHTRLQEALVEFTQLLLSEFVVADVLKRLCEHARAIIPADGAGVSLPGKDGLHVGWAAGPNVERLENMQRSLDDGPCLDVFADGQELRVRLADEKERWQAYVEEALGLGVRGMAALPLQARGRTWGVLDLYSASDIGFSDEQMRAARALADSATAYLITARDRREQQMLEEQLRLQALHDSLTGLPNRVLLLDRLRHALADVPRHPKSVGVLFMDLDRFKQVNDAHGHAAGDQLLIKVAGRLRDVLRPADTLARMGGDEFVILCENMHLTEEDLHGIGMRLLAALAVPIRLTEGDVMVRGSIGSGAAHRR